MLVPPKAHKSVHSSFISKSQNLRIPQVSHTFTYGMNSAIKKERATDTHYRKLCWVSKARLLPRVRDGNRGGVKSVGWKMTTGETLVAIQCPPPYLFLTSIHNLVLFQFCKTLPLGATGQKAHVDHSVSFLTSHTVPPYSPRSKLNLKQRVNKWNTHTWASPPYCFRSSGDLKICISSKFPGTAGRRPAATEANAPIWC